MLSDFYKETEKSKIWRVDDINQIGKFLFSFDKKTVYNFWTDYEKLTPEQKQIFDKEFPAMAELK
ncbi:MAG: hypothetical protein J6K92_10370 [Oscillospiraceae bacterium]|nr:hypothetical protein [Oscillospiraceae bacterium]